MNRKRILGLWLVLLMLVMTACGKAQSTTQDVIQEFETNTQMVEPITPESESQEYAKAGETEAEDQDQSDALIDEAATQDNSEVNGAPETQTEKPDAPEPESEVQEQTSGIEASQEDIVNDNLPTYGNNYYDLVNVVLYLDVYDELPPNYITKNEAQALGWEGGSVEKYKEGAAIGGDTFGNREGLLPTSDGRKYTECDIDTHGYSSRGSRRLVFSNDGLYFYTSDHYESFSEVTVTDNYEVVW